MNPFYWFLGIVFVLIVGTGIVIRDSIRRILSLMATNAQTYAIVYVKGIAFVFVAMAVSFRDTFRGLPTDVAASYSWWDWVMLYLAPLLAGANALLAFLDRSAERARAERDEKAAAGTTPDPIISPEPRPSEPQQ